MSRSMRGLLVALLAGVMLLSGFALSTRPVAAGWNGQHIQVNYCFATHITFKGYNQNGQWTVKDYRTSGGTTKTPNDWWVGSVTAVSYQFILGQERSSTKIISVPKFQLIGDWTVTNGCL